MDKRSRHIASLVEGTVLDIGHSVGPLNDYIRKTASEVYSIDIIIKGPKEGILKADCENMPFQAESFDTIVAGEVIEHLHNPEKLVSEARRVLKTNGLFILTTPNVKSLVNRLTKCYHAPAHIALFTKKDLLSLLEKHGFAIKDYTLYPYTKESSEGSTHNWFYPVRSLLHYVIPKNLQEEMFIVAEKK